MAALDTKVLGRFTVGVQYRDKIDKTLADRGGNGVRLEFRTFSKEQKGICFSKGKRANLAYCQFTRTVPVKLLQHLDTF